MHGGVSFRAHKKTSIDLNWWGCISLEPTQKAHFQRSFNKLASAEMGSFQSIENGSNVARSSIHEAIWRDESSD